MPVVGFHQTRHPRQTLGARLHRELSWPRPGGVLLSLVGATLVLVGALALDASTGSAGPSGAAPASAHSGTDASQVLSSPTASATPTHDPAPSAKQKPLSASGSSASPIAPATTPAQTLVKGAASGSPIQKLFATGSEVPSDKKLLDIFNPNSSLVLVNKTHQLSPLKYAPKDLRAPAVTTGSQEPGALRAEAAAAAERMFTAAAAQGVNLTLMSSYRSYDTQFNLYNSYVAQKGAAAADTTSARPGFSEHQTGLAIDIGDAAAGSACDFTSCFAGNPAAQWVAAHAHDHGFVVRYVPGAELKTGYLAEPWHLRYLGVGAAQDMKVRGIASYEEYLGLPGSPGYK